MARVEEKASDGRVLDLIRGWLKADILKGLERWTPVRGSPQGAVISPLLANIYLDPLDAANREHAQRPLCCPDDPHHHLASHGSLAQRDATESAPRPQTLPVPQRAGQSGSGGSPWQIGSRFVRP